MARYRITSVSFVNDMIVGPGQAVQEITVAKTVKPGPHWEPLDAEAKVAFKAAGYDKVSDPMDPTEQLDVNPANNEAP